MKLYIYVLLALFLATGCAEDKGNYDYLETNAIAIDSVGGTLSVVQFDTLTIKPFLKFEREELKNLSFEWKVNGKVVSNDRICRAEITEVPNKSDEKYEGIFCVTNNANDLKYYKRFEVKVGTAYSNALYILSEEADGQAVLSFQRRDKANIGIISHIYEAANPRLGSLGKKPRQVFCGGSQKKFMVLCEEGDKKMVTLNPSTLQLDRNYAEGAIMGTYGGTFTPYKIKLVMGGMVTAKEGIFGYNYMNSGALYRPIEGDYSFANWVDCNTTMDAYLWITYDNKSEQFMRLEITKGIAYDLVTPISKEGFSTQGQKFLAGGHSGYDLSRPVLYNAAEKKAYFYSISMTADEWDMSTMTPIWVIEPKKLMVQDNLMDENSVSIFGEKSLYWFIANGNKVVRLHGDGGAISDVYTVPNGNVTTMMLDTKEERLFIGASDGTKSWIYVVSALTADLGALKEAPMDMDGKIVSLAATGKWTY